MRYSVFNVDVMQVFSHIDKWLRLSPSISRKDANSVLPKVREMEEENHPVPLSTDEMEIGEREADLQAQVTRSNNRIVELEKILADLQAQRNTASLSVPITREDDYRVSPEVPDGKERDWLAWFECKVTFYSFVSLK